MAEPTLVNGQITDAVTQANVQTLAVAPSQAIASLYISLSHSLAIAAANAVANQQNVAALAQAVTTSSVNRLLRPAPPAGLTK
jgi:hypothetical protein